MLKGSDDNVDLQQIIPLSETKLNQHIMQETIYLEKQLYDQNNHSFAQNSDYHNPHHHRHQSDTTETKHQSPCISNHKQQIKTEKKVRFKEDDEDFRMSYEAFTVDPSKGLNAEYISPDKRVQSIASLGSMERPDFEDALRRVAVVLHQHISTCVKRWNRATPDMYEVGQFHRSKMTDFSEENFITPKYKYTFIRIPMAVPGMCYRMEKIQQEYPEPSATEIYDFMLTLFRQARLSSECSIVSLIYIERLMQRAHVPVMPTTWRPIVICGLLLASKVWQDYSSWNVEFSIIFPQYSLKAINRLERIFVANIQWQLGIKSSEYAKYYFALRSMTEKRDFRARYNYVIKVAPPTQAQAIQQRSEAVESFILSKSL